MEIILIVTGLVAVITVALVLAMWEDRQTRKYLTRRKAEEQAQLQQIREQQETEQVILAPNPQAALLVAQLQDQLHKKEAQVAKLAQESKLAQELQAVNQQVQEVTQEIKVVLEETVKMAPAVEMVPAEALVKPKRKKRQPRKKKPAKQI